MPKHVVKHSYRRFISTSVCNCGWTLKYDIRDAPGDSFDIARERASFHVAEEEEKAEIRERELRIREAELGLRKNV